MLTKKIIKNKRIVPTTLLLLYCLFAIGQGSWTQKADFGGGFRSWTFGISIAGKGYMGLGVQNSTRQNDWWEYDTLTDTWTRKADFPGGPRSRGVGFSIGNKGYFGLGSTNSGNPSNDFWEYNPQTDTWIQKASFPAGGRDEATGFSIGNNGYVGLGIDGTSTFHKDLWKYDTTLNQWTQMANLPGSIRAEATSFSIGNKAYVGLGAYTTAFSDLWEYNSTTNIWSAKASFPIPLFNAVGFSIGTKGYIGTGNPNSSSRTKIFYEYDTLANSWTQKANVSTVNRCVAAGFSIGNKGYIGTGYDSAMIFLKDFWEFNPTQYSAIKINSIQSAYKIYPNPTSDQSTLQFDNTKKEICTLTLYDLRGQIMRTINNITSDQVVIHKNDLTNGLYYFVLRTGDRVIVTGKLAVD